MLFRDSTLKGRNRGELGWVDSRKTNAREKRGLV